ncbi:MULTISPECIES: DedA family protein [Amycolatopsis]|uniref:DedA family protein n=1 Tax=Amycolatopsis tucumanensis TaxID=401106 RepID=A0ABP7ILC1_9PSEU|nr:MULTISPECIES: VTT domain-containing protein [Amycolatopsis]MCF6422906.1 VTT domain-containing protein [Amycolatopsis tucumanensis]
MIDAIATLPPALVYLVAAAVIAAETALLPGIVLPTLSTLLLVGFLAGQGTVDLWLAMAVVAAAAVFGDQLAYLEGRRLGRRITSARWRRVESRIARYGVVAVFAARFLAGARTLMPRVAGAAAVPYPRFLLVSMAAAVVWVVAALLVGKAGGSLIG